MEHFFQVFWDALATVVFGAIALFIYFWKWLVVDILMPYLPHTPFQFFGALIFVIFLGNTYIGRLMLLKTAYYLGMLFWFVLPNGWSTFRRNRARRRLAKNNPNYIHRNT